MRKGIWQKFDGYQDVVDEIKVSRRLGGTASSVVIAAEEYIRQLHPERQQLYVSDIIEETTSTKTLRLVSKDNYLPPFLAGQYIALFLEVGGIRTSRPYSISSQPKQVGYYDITIRRVENGLDTLPGKGRVKGMIGFPVKDDVGRIEPGVFQHDLRIGGQGIAQAVDMAFSGPVGHRRNHNSGFIPQTGHIPRPAVVGPVDVKYPESDGHQDHPDQNRQ